MALLLRTRPAVRPIRRRGDRSLAVDSPFRLASVAPGGLLHDGAATMRRRCWRATYRESRRDVADCTADRAEDTRHTTGRADDEEEGAPAALLICEANARGSFGPDSEMSINSRIAGFKRPVKK